MAVTRANVIAVAPELGSVEEADPRWEAFLTDADLFVGATVLGAARSDAAKKYLVAHWMTAAVVQESAASGATGALKSVTIGPVTKTYDAGSASVVSHDNLKSTRYGALYLQLIRVAAIGVL